MVQAMLVEALLIVLAGAAVGLPLAFLLNRIPFVNQMALMQDAMAIDGQLIPFALAIIVGATIVCGLVPALRSTRIDGTAGVRSSADVVTPRLGFRRGLVVVQLAISLVLVVATLLCVRSQEHISQVDVGFDLEQQRLEPLHDACGLLRVRSGPDVEHVIGLADPQLLEEHGGHAGVVVLARVHERVLERVGAPEQLRRDRRRLHEVRPCAHDRDDLQLPSHRRAPMIEAGPER